MSDMKLNESVKEFKHFSKIATQPVQDVTTTSQPVSQAKPKPLPEKVQVYQKYLKSLYQKNRFPVYYKFPEYLKLDHYIKLALVTKSLRRKGTDEDLTLKLHGKIDELALKRKRVQLSIYDV